MRRMLAPGIARRLLSVLLVSVAMGGAFAGGVVLSTWMEERIDGVRGRVVSMLEDASAQTLSWDSVSPSIVRGITIYGVRISDSARARRVTVRLNLIAALFGDGRDLIPAVIIDRAAIDISTPDQRQRLDQTISWIVDNAEGRRDIEIRVLEGRIAWENEDIRLEAAKLSGQLQLIGAATEAQLSSDLTLVQKQADIATDARLNAALSAVRRQPELEANIDLRDITGSHFTMEDQSFRVDRNARQITVARIRSADPLDLRAVYDLETGFVDATLLSRDYQPDETINLRGAWAEYQPWLSTVVTSDLRVSLGPEGGLRAAGGTLAAQLENPQLPAPAALEATFQATSERISFERLSVRSGGGSARARGSYEFGPGIPRARLDFSRFSYGPIPVLNGRVSLDYAEGQSLLSAGLLEIDGVAVHQLDASITRGERYASLRGSAQLRADTRGRVEASARFASMEDFAAELRLRNVLPSNLLAVANRLGVGPETLPTLLAGTRVNGVVRLDQREGSLRASMPYLTIADSSRSRLAGLSARYRNGTVVVHQLYAIVDGTRIHADGFVRIGSAGTVDIRTDLMVNALTYELRGTVTPEGDVTVVGPSGVELRLTRESGNLRISGRLDDVALPLGGSRVDGRFEGLYFAPEQWYLNGRDIRVSNLPAPGGGSASAELALGLRPGIGRIGLLRYEDNVGALSGGFDITFRTAGAADLQTTGQIASFDGTERYRLAARVAEGVLAADLRFSGSPARRVLPQARAGTLAGTVQLLGGSQDRQLRALVESQDIRLQQEDLQFRVMAYLDPNEIRLTESSMGLGTTALDLRSAVLDRSDGSIELEGSLERRDLGRRYQIGLSGQTAPLPELEMSVLLSQPLSARLTIAPTESRSDEPDAAVPFLIGSYQIERGDGTTRIRRADGALDASFVDGGGFSIRADDPLPLRFTAEGSVNRGDLQLSVSAITADLPRLARLAPLEGLDVRSGTLQGAVRLIGSPADPDMFGTLNLRNLETSVPIGPERVGPVDATLIIEEKTLRLPRISISAGESTVDLSARALLSRLNLAEFEVLMEIAGAPGIRVERSFGPVAVDGFARGSLQLAGTPNDIQLSGTLVASGTEVTIDDQPREASSGSESSLLLDLDVQTGRAVQFIWPDPDFPILRSSFATGQTVEIRANTAEQQFALNGSLDIQSGDIFYFDRNFLIRDGSIVFNETAEDFDPRLSARAELREVTPDGPVRIYLVADRQRLSEFSPRFESNPPLAGTDIVAILGGNIFQQGESDSVNLTTALLSTSDVVTQFGVFRQFEDTMREALNLDLFAIRTSVIQNVLLTAIEPTDPTQEQLAPSLGNFLDNTSVFMGRYLGEDVFGQAVLQLRSREADPRIEDDPGIQRLGGVLIDSEIRLEWETPFFLLEWNLAPENPEELFIRDNTFTFSWSYSY